MSDFVNLHVHGQRSELDGLTRTSQQIEAALADGQRAVAITDHGDCGAHFDVNKSALAAGLTPILGLEAYLSIGPRTERNVVRVPAEDDFDGGGDSDGATKEKREIADPAIHVPAAQVDEQCAIERGGEIVHR